MKILKDRQEIAMACNFRKYPVLSIDLAEKDSYGLKGCKVRVDAGTFDTGEPHTIGAELRVYRDEKKLTLSSEQIGLSATFTYSDYVHILERAQAPLIGPDMDVVVMIYDSRTKNAFSPVIVHTAKMVNKFCSCPLSFEDADFSAYLQLAGFRDEK